MSSPAIEKDSSKQRELFEIADRVLPGSGLGSYSLADDIRLIYSHGKGSRMWDVDGNEYIDYVGGAGALILGHSHPAVVKAAQAQFERGAHMFGSLNEVAVHLAERLVNDLYGENATIDNVYDLEEMKPMTFDIKQVLERFDSESAAAKKAKQDEAIKETEPTETSKEKPQWQG